MYDIVQQGQENERIDGYGDYVSEPYNHNNPERIAIDDLDYLTLEDYGLSPDTLKAEMFGINIVDPQTGEPLPPSFYQSKLEKALAQAEQNLDIAIFPRLEYEHQDFHTQNASSYMYTHTHKRPILQVEELNLEFSGRPIYRYPSQWWNVYSLSGHIEIMPSPLSTSLNGGFAQTWNMQAISQMGSYRSSQKTFAPQMIHVKYIAGLLPRKNGNYNREWEMPATLEEYILKLATREILQVWGRLVVPMGLQGSTLVMDGISETINTTRSATNTAISGEIKELDKTIANLEKSLKQYFGGSFVTV